MLCLRTADHSGSQVFGCATCPYVYPITRAYTDRTVRKQFKAQDDILGGKEEWANAPQAGATCPKCSAESAYFREIQTRSADEPMTVFYKCVECAFDWKEG